MPTVAFLVYASGLNNHRSFYLNTLISTTVLSILFLVLITIGLYNGWKLKDTLGDFRKKVDLEKGPDISQLDFPSIDLSDSIEGGIFGIIISLFLWLIIGLLVSFLFWLAGGVIWAIILLIAGLLYWIIFRAFRLVFRHSPNCKGKLINALGTALAYTVLYNFWIYMIVIGAHFLNK